MKFTEFEKCDLRFLKEFGIRKSEFEIKKTAPFPEQLFKFKPISSIILHHAGHPAATHGRVRHRVVFLLLDNNCLGGKEHASY